MRVVVLEVDALHTDRPFSTHAIQASGMDRFDELGMGARIRELTPVRCALHGARSGAVPAMGVARGWGREYARELRNTLLALPLTAAIAAAEPVAPPIGLLKAIPSWFAT